LLAEKIQERAVARGIQPYADKRGVNHNLATLYDEMSADGTYTPDAAGEERALDYILQYSHVTRNSGLGEGAWAKAAEKGMVKIKAVQPSAWPSGSTRSIATTQRTVRCIPMGGLWNARIPGQP